MRCRIVLAAIPTAVLLAGCGSEPAADNRAAPAANTAAAPASTAAGPARPVPPASNAATAATPAPAGPLSASGYALVGTEPFWGGSVRGTRVRYMTPENQFGTVVETTRSSAGGEEVYRGRLAGQPFVLALRRAACSDGMSDRTHAFTVALEVRGERRRGCADPE